MQVQLLLEVGQDRQPHSISFKIIEIFLKAIHLYPPLVAVKLAEISGLTSKTARKNINHFKGIYRTFIQLKKKNYKNITTFHWLDLQAPHATSFT